MGHDTGSGITKAKMVFVHFALGMSFLHRGIQTKVSIWGDDKIEEMNFALALLIRHCTNKLVIMLSC